MLAIYNLQFISRTIKCLIAKLIHKPKQNKKIDFNKKITNYKPNQMFVVNIIKNLFSQKPKQILLGRWNIQYEPKIIHFKNEDHCGCCQLLPQEHKNHKQLKQQEQDEYLLPYTL